MISGPTVFYCDQHVIPLPEGHKFPIRKYRLLRERLEASKQFSLQPAPMAGLESITAAHDAEYAQASLSGTLSAAAIRRIGFPWSPGLVARTLASVGSTLTASRLALEYGWSGGLAGGTHHAFRSEGAGFCVFNDIAIAIEVLKRDGAVLRAAVLDLDVHQGDGTAAMFAGDPNVLTISLHGRNNFPFRKQQSKIDVEFEDGTGDEEYVTALANVLPHVVAFRPDIVFFQAGVDALQEDRLGKLALTHAGLRKRDDMVFSLPLPVVLTLGGGYSDPIDATVEAHANTFLRAAQRAPLI